MTPDNIVMPPGLDQTEKPKRQQNRKNKLSPHRLQYLRDYRKAQKAALDVLKAKNTVNPRRLSSELSENATYDETTKTSGGQHRTSLVTGNRERDILLRELESLRRSGNDMAALAAIKAYAELAGISAQESKIGSLSPDQAIRYRDAVQANLRDSLERGKGIVEVLTVDGYERIVGSRADVLAAIDRLLPADTTADTTICSNQPISTPIEAAEHVAITDTSQQKPINID